jgi:hypothetical protein
MSNTNTSSGLGFTSILTLIFVLCKLTHYINWSWWWVLSPVLIGAGFTLVVLFTILVIAVLVAASK